MNEATEALKKFNELSMTIQSKKNMENLLLASIKVNGVDLSQMVSHWQIRQAAHGIPELVLTIPLHDVPQIVL